MMRVGLISIAAVAAACTSGDTPQNNTIGRICSADLSITGTFTVGAAAPNNPDGTPHTGCWPIGTWTFSATLGENECTDTPMLLPNYVFTGTLGSDMDGDYTENFSYTTDPTADAIVKVTAAGNAMCEGELDLFSSDGLKEWDLSPWLNPDNSINGQGTYNEYTTDQWVGSGSGSQP